VPAETTAFKLNAISASKTSLTRLERVFIALNEIADRLFFGRCLNQPG
jgi:hypothetical protein